MVDDAATLYLERGGRGLITLGRTRDDRTLLAAAMTALAQAVRDKRVPKLALERIDGAPVIGSDAETLLLELGFGAGPRRLTLSA
jgi:ATP-dependent Lhr-like helicase